MGPTQPPIQWVPGAPFLGIKRSGREADHSHSSTAEVKECVELYLYSHSTPSMAMDNITLTFMNPNKIFVLEDLQFYNPQQTENILEIHIHLKIKKTVKKKA
jgi:hypothetical protein